MAFPVILVDSATGSDTGTSGAGPSTAVTGTAGATDGAGTTVTLDAGTDLSGVATDGSHAIYLADTTAGHRRFAQITGTSGSGGATPTVTVAAAYTASLSGVSWAIGGVRASVGGAVSALLLDNNGSAGDAMPGWIVEMQSGHTETIGATLSFQRAGDSTSGPIVLRGDPTAAVLPIVTFTNNDMGFQLRKNFTRLESMELRNTNATKTASEAVRCATSAGGIFAYVRFVKIAHSTDTFWKGIVANDGGSGSSSQWIESNEVGYTVSSGIEVNFSASNVRGLSIVNNYVHDVGGVGIFVVGDIPSVNILWNIVYNAASDGILVSNNNGGGNRSSVIVGNTVDSCGGDGIEITNVDTVVVAPNNSLTNNGGYGINFSSVSNTAIRLAATVTRLLGNNFYLNTSGKYNPSGLDAVGVSVNESTVDPQFVDAAGGDFSVGANLAAKGYPLAGTLPVGQYSATYSYVDIGAAQRQASSGSGVGAQIFGG